MYIYPPIKLSLLNGLILILPMLVLRFGLPALVRKEALADLDYFPPVHGPERTALRIYFATNIFLIFSPSLARLQSSQPLSALGWVIYFCGLSVMALALFHFSASSGHLAKKGIYRFSRNPMYIGYFMIYIGIALLIGSWFHLAMTFVYQIAVHWLILSEERWCLEKFGESYESYYRQVRRYI